MQDFSSTMEPVREQASHTVSDLKDLIREAEIALSNVGDQASDQVRDLRERLRGALNSTQSRLQRTASYVKEQGAVVDEVIRDNPYASIGIAAALGLIAGVFIGRSVGSDSHNGR